MEGAMTLSRQSSRVYMDAYDLDGTVNVLGKRVQEGGPRAPYYIGAHVALNLIRNHDRIETQQDFMTLFDSVLAHEDQQRT